MRWKTKEYQNGSGAWLRDYKRFLFLPKKIDGEWRWLEITTWRSQRVNNKWIDINWVN